MTDDRAERAGTRSGAGTRTAHDVIRRLILEGDLEPGMEISQLELSRKLSISRTPLREALRLLEREGLVVDTGPHRSVRISPLSMEDLDNLYSMRVLGEGLASWLTVPILRTKDIDRLEHAAERAATGDAEAHRRFHAIMRLGAGQRLADQLEQYYDHAERYLHVFMRQGIDDEVVHSKLTEHMEIVKACRKHDRRLARDLLVDHIAGTAITLMTMERHAPFALPAALAMAKAVTDDDLITDRP